MDEMRKASAALAWRGKTAVMSTPRVDRVGDVIELSAWDLDDFKANPVMLYEHDRAMPIGVWRDVRIEDGALVGEPVFHPADINPLAGKIAALVDGRWIKGFSVGFVPSEMSPLADGQRGYRITKAKLLECSVVAIPANADALLKSAPGAMVPVYAAKADVADLWAKRDADAIGKWVAPATETKVESAPMTLTDDVRAAIKAAVAEAMKQPDAQTPPKAGDDGAAAGKDEDPLATAIAAVDEAADAVVGLMADIEGDQDDGA